MVGLAACGDNAPRILRTISLDPGSPKLAAGVTLDVKASYVAADQTPMDAPDVTFTVSDATVATVTPGTGGHATLLGVAVGSTTLNVAGSGALATFTVTVTPAVLTDIQITPPAPSLAAGTSVQLTATGVFSDKTSMNLTRMATWKSSAVATATVDNDTAKGLVSALVKGPATISATVNGVTGSTLFNVTDAVLVSIQVTPIAPRIVAGTTQQFIARGTFSDTSTQDLTTQVLWESSDTGIATISNADPTRGLATGATAGRVTITATLDNIPGTQTLIVSDATVVSIQLDPVNASVARGFTLDYTATGVFSDGTHQVLTELATWTSSDDTIAAISGAPGSRGEAHGLHEGTVTISATFGTVTGTTSLSVTPAVLLSIAVTPADPSLPIGHSLGFTATGTFSDGPRDLTTQVGWSVSPDGFATISNLDGTRGVATAVALGTTTVTATFPGATPVVGSTSLTVTAAVVDSITVAPADHSLAKGLQLQFHATGNLSDGHTEDLTTQATWTSGTTTVAQIDDAAAKGLATALDPGTTTISAAFAGKTGSTSLTVSAAELVSIDVTPETTNQMIGATPLHYTATGMYTDGSMQDLTTQVEWTADPTTVAQIDPGTGVAVAVGVGTATITATFLTTAGPVSGHATFNVLAPNVATLPRDATTGLRISTPIVVTFDQAMALSAPAAR